MAMTDEQIERYSRHIILKEVGVKGTEEAPERKSTGSSVQERLVHLRQCIWQQQVGNNRYCGCGPR